MYIEALHSFNFSHLRPLTSEVMSISHRETIVQLGYDSCHIANPFYPLFYPHRSEFLTLFHEMWPRIDNQNTLKSG